MKQIARLPLDKILSALSQQHGWRGAVIVVVDEGNENSTRVASHGLNFDERERGLVAALYLHTDEKIKAQASEPEEGQS
jgi:hypothetical protein